MFKVSFQNSAGELDYRKCREKDVPEAIMQMIGELDSFYTGDKIVITDLDDEK